MLTLYTKERLSRPKLSSVEGGSIANKPPEPTALQYLKSLKPGELILESDDDISDIEDPFENIKNSDNIVKGFEKTKKRLTRLEQSIQLMSSFSDDFKRALDETRKELELETKLTYEDMNQISKTIEEFSISKTLSNSLEEKLDKIFLDEENLNCGSDLDIPDRDPDTGKPIEKPESAETEIKNDKESVSESDKDVDELSGIWNMLKTTEGLIVSPPFYDAYRQQTPHWLDRPGEKWSRMDKAKYKCEDWFKKQENPSKKSANGKKDKKEKNKK